MNRVIKKIKEAKRSGKKLFCAYLTLGYPNLESTYKLIRSFEPLGADLIEVGFPFSDPLADGPVIQAASEWALAREVSLEDAFELGKKLRRNACEVPLIFFSYYNPIFHLGLDRFAAKLKQSGYDGLLCPDLPPDEESFLPAKLAEEDISLIYLAAPTTDTKRLRVIARRTSGFIYYVSLKGVTGMRKELSAGLREKIQKIKRITEKPVLIGFGVSNPEQARKASAYSDGVIVGSAIIDSIRRNRGRIAPVLAFVKKLSQAVHRENSLS